MIETLGQARDNGWKITARCAGERKQFVAVCWYAFKKGTDL
jgi:hypothetical protein